MKATIKRRATTDNRQAREVEEQVIMLLPGDTLQAILSDRRTFLYKH
jgi:hypothetical protein